MICMDRETMSISDQLPETVSWLFDNDPLAAPNVETRARLLFLDTLGCMIAGLAKPEPNALARDLGVLEPGAVSLPNAPLMTAAAALALTLSAQPAALCDPGR